MAVIHTDETALKPGNKPGVFQAPSPGFFRLPI
jgi:hypothetical protein